MFPLCRGVRPRKGVKAVKSKLSPRFWLALVLLSLVGQVAWVVENMYLNVFIYKMFRATAGQISLMVAASAVAATLTTVLMGALSDRLGKRKLFICGGYLLWGVSIFAFGLLKTEVLGKLFPMTVSAATLGVSLTIGLDCVMTFFGSTANDAAFNAWVTDSTDETNRGAAEGVCAMMPLVAILAVFGGFMAFDLDKSESWQSIFTIIGAVVTAVGLVGLLLIREGEAKPSATGFFYNVFYGFRPSTMGKNGRLYLTLAAFVLFNIAIQIFMPYLILYYEVSLGMTDYVLVMAPAIVLASVVTALWGKVYDKKGFGASVVPAMLWLAAGFVLLYFTRDRLPVFVGSLFMMCGYLSGMAVFGARIRDLTPRGKAGMLQGVRICAQVLLPGVIGPWIGKTVLQGAEQIQGTDGTFSFVPNENIFLAALLTAAVTGLFLLLTAPKKQPRLEKLTTPFEGDGGEGWRAYPRPRMKRESYLSLCGTWQLSVEKNLREIEIGPIEVPFPPESRLSGVERTLEKGESWIYRVSFHVPPEFRQEKTLLHFGAVDQKARVWFNGRLVGEHEGGYLPFTMDVSEHLFVGENTLTVRVTDPLDRELAWGKQRKDRGGMWYTPVSGIWQAVWLESLPAQYIEDIRVTPSLTGVTLEVQGGAEEKTLLFEGKEYAFTGDHFTLEVEDPVLWTPESPRLYPFTLLSGGDRVESYFALRTITVEHRADKSWICLNGKPFFFHGLLDQGYFPDGIYTPATPRGLENDVLEMKRLGFNLLRKHIKIEPELFYYYCDQHGMLVCQDMVNSGSYSFFADTLLPTLGVKKGIRHRATARRRQHFEESCRETVRLLCSHPSVFAFTIFNEGWGQYDADRLYRELKALDPTRVWDATSGWFREKKSDVDSHHVYFKKVRLRPRPHRPLVLSEFGGYSCRVAEHVFNLDKSYGYKTVKNPGAFMDSLEKLYMTQIVPAAARGLCVSVLTQVSDVEDEINGLVTYDRRVCKADRIRMLAIARALEEAFLQWTGEGGEMYQDKR